MAKETAEERSKRELREAQTKAAGEHARIAKAVSDRAEKERLQASGEWPKNDPVPGS